MAEYVSQSYLGRMPDEYFSALDRKQYVPDVSGEAPPAVTGMKNLGIPTPPMQDQVQSLKQRIYQGASLVELGFMGAGKGSMGQGATTPGMYGYEHRQAMRELAKQNEIKLTTHVTTRHPPLSGFGQQGFSDEARKQALEEIERTIDFAADVAGGGPVTVHTGEFNRRVSEVPGSKRGGFDRYRDFEDTTPEYFVDKRTGSIANEVRPNEDVMWTEMERNPDGTLKVDEYGQFVPKFHKEGGYDSRPITRDDIDALKEYYRRTRGIEIGDDEAKARAKIEQQVRTAEGWAQQSQTRIAEELEQIKILEKQRDDFAAKWDDLTEEQRRFYRDTALATATGGRIPPHLRDADALEILDTLIAQQKAGLKYNQDVATNYQQEARRNESVLENLETVESYAKTKTADTIAKAGLYAMERSDQKNRFGERSKDPIYISPENIFPEQYGSHPEELRDIVRSSRKRMEEHLVEERGMSADQARKKAENHIKATFDIGHANMWKKYFKGKDKDFDSWIVEQAEKLAQEGIIGHVHVSDNLGYNDEHLSPGQGNAPISDFVKRMKAQGKVDVIVEPAHNDFEVLREGWRTLAGSITQNFSVANDRWVNIEHSYFGRASSPYFLVGQTVPNQEAYQLWSGVPFE